jgi:hypothetical protein
VQLISGSRELRTGRNVTLVGGAPSTHQVNGLLDHLPTRVADYQSARSDNPSAYSVQNSPATGPPLQVPSDSPGTLTHR